MDKQDIGIYSGIAETPYIFEKNHTLLGYGGSGLGRNIGDNGENLTIAVLSMNRSSLTIKMMKSIAENIPNFKGELLIADNGSEKEELYVLKEKIKDMPYKCRIIEFEKNYGVAGGRNKTMNYVKTKWVLCLDNDIYFISNPLSEIKKTISELGCHFMNLPLLDETGSKIFALGGHIYLHNSDGKVSIGGGTPYQQIDYNGTLSKEPFISTFLFGGASVINKETFQSLGGYDEGMFIGFEDIDFSVKLFQKGMKVGNCGVFSLIHDHKKPSHKTDKDYEKERYSEKILKESADYFEKKHGFIVWSDGVSSWLKDRHKELGLTLDVEDVKNESNSLNSELRNSSLPKIALVTDTDNWAFANISRQLKRYLSSYFDFKIIPMSMVEDIGQLLLITKDYDLIHFFWRPYIGQINFENIKIYTDRIGVDYERFYERFLTDLNISTCVYDHLYLDKDSLNLNKSIFKSAPNYYVSSKKLFDIYKNTEFSPKPSCVLEDGVDLTLFKPINIERFKGIQNREIVIGWSGNSKWTDEIEDFKGVNTILKPAIEQLMLEGYSIKTYFADRSERMIPHMDMVNYYSKIDVYVCTSKIEGTPNPVLESMACGVPVISTDVGIVPQVFGNKQKEFILKERSVGCLKEAIKNLIQQPNLFKELSNENIYQIKEWDWSKKTLGFRDFFYKCLNEIKK